MYRPPAPSGATAPICPTTIGKPPTAMPVTASIGTPAPVGGPTALKLPPR